MSRVSSRPPPCPTWTYWEAREPQHILPPTPRNHWQRLSHRYRTSMDSEEQLYLSLKAKVKSATRALMLEPDWAANMEIIDMCNDKPKYLPHVFRVFNKRIRHWNPNVGFLALTLVEALVKNCPACHPYVTSTEFVDSMMKELYRKKEKKTLLQHIQLQQQNVSEVSRLQRRDKILLLIESWGKSAQHSNSFDIYQITYNDLKRQGFSFPVPLKDELSPVFTPQAKPRANPDSEQSGPVKDGKLQDCLANIELFMDTLNESISEENVADNEIVQILKSKLESAQSKILERISSDPSEELMNELLIVNDELCQALEFYKKVVSGQIRPKKRTGPKPIRGKGQRVSAVEPQFADILGVESLPSAPSYASESEEETPENSGDDNNEIDPKEPTELLSKDKRLVNAASGSSSKSEHNNMELVAFAKGISPPRSNNKVRALKNKTSNESNSSKDQWSKDTAPNSDNPFDILDTQMKPDNAAQAAAANPFASGDELLTSLVVNPNKNARPAPKKQPDLSFFDPL